MFKDLVEPWGQFIAKIGQAWAPDDPRRELNLEVVERLFQLDIVLEYLNNALTIFSGNPAEEGLKNDVRAQAFKQVVSGEMTKENYRDRMATLTWKSREELEKQFRAQDEIRLFTEAFYFFAWRLVEILKSKTFYFDGFSKLSTKGILTVRNHLLQHPEKYGRNFRQVFPITSDGPILKAGDPVIRLLPDKVEVEHPGLDRGLFVNAQELHDEIIEILRRILK
jgi:hypothetical protein